MTMTTTSTSTSTSTGTAGVASRGGGGGGDGGGGWWCAGAAMGHGVGNRARSSSSSMMMSSSSSMTSLSMMLTAVLAGVGVGCGMDSSARCEAAATAPDPNAPTSNKSTAQWRIYTDIGRGLVQEKKLDEARRYLERALVEAKKGFGEDDAHVAAALNNLAELNRIESKWSESERFFSESLEILRKAYGENHPAVGTALHNLAGCRLAQGDADGAYALYAKSLERKEATLGTNHPEYATTLYHMAEVLSRSDRKQDAVVLLERSIKVSEEIGAAHTDACLRRMKRLAQLLWDCENYEHAERIRRRILSTMEHMNGEEHVKIAGPCESLATVLMKLDQLDEAAALLERSARILSKVRGDGGALALASTRLNLADIAFRRDNVKEALKFARQALDVLAPSALDAIRRDALRVDIRVGVVAQYARAAALLAKLSPDAPSTSRHVEDARQYLDEIEKLVTAVSSSTPTPASLETIRVARRAL